MSKRKNKQTKKVAAKASAANKSNFKAILKSRGLSFAIAAVIIVVVVLAIWGIKGFADAGSDANDEAVRSGSQSTASEASSRPQSTSSFQGDIWELDASSIDMDEVTALGVPAIMDFGSDECIPCKQMAPVLRDTNAAMQGKALIKFVDVWE